MKQENRMSLKLESTLGLGDVRVSMGAHTKVLYQGKPLGLTSIFNLVKSRTPLYYMSDLCVIKFLPAKLVYEQDVYGNETIVLYDVDGKHWYDSLYTDPSEAFNELYQKQMRRIEQERAKLLAMKEREQKSVSKPNE